jgi:hypothetical protein
VKLRVTQAKPQKSDRDTIISAIPQDNFLVEIITSGGVSGTFDVKPYFGGSAFKELQDEWYFRLVRPALYDLV